MEIDRQEFRASLSLKYSPGLGLRTSKKILEHFGAAGAAVDQAKRWPGLGLATPQQCQAFLAQSWLSGAQAELHGAEELGLPVLCWADPRYPERLREIPDPPVVLYAVGDLSLLKNPGVALVGSRECTRYGIELAHRIAMELSDTGVTVVSGLAYGIDREAHLGGLKGPGGSIAVMGTGPDLVYPASNRDLWRAMAAKGLILSEFAPKTKPHAGNFPLRNRLISGLSLGVVVAEASIRSGSLITARLALEQGREVFAVPGPVSLKSYRGCHELINKGAKLVHAASDILMELKPQLDAFLKNHDAPQVAAASRAPAKQAEPAQGRLVAALPPRRQGKSPSPEAVKAVRPALSPQPARSKPCAKNPGKRKIKAGQDAQTARPPQDAPLIDARMTFGAPGAPSLEQDVADHLAASGAAHIDSLCRIFGRPAGELSRTLVLLELKGVVCRLPGGYYRPV